MVNGKLETWQVIKWLSSHPTHTAKAPKTKEEERFKCLAEDYAHVSKGILGLDVVFGAHNIRSDWTIYNERGKRVRFKRKRKLERVGELPERRRIFVVGGSITTCLYSNRSDRPVDVFIRERKS